jgi:hypothetical protein
MRRLLCTVVLLLAGLPSAHGQQVGVPTYYGNVLNFTTADAATDVVCLEGAAGKVVKVNGAFFAGTVVSGTAATINLLTLRRISLNVGGTSNVVVPASGNPTHGPALAKMKVWSVNPTTLGDTAAPPAGFAFRRLRWDISSTISSPDSSPMIAAQANNPYTSQPEIRSATQAICLNYQPTPPAPPTTININLVWTETNE